MWGRDQFEPPHEINGDESEFVKSTNTKPDLRGNVRPSSRRSGDSVLWLSSPALVWYAIFTIGPLVAMFYIATLNWSGLLAPVSFSGLENFKKVLGDVVFWVALKNSAIQLAVVLPIMMPLAFLLGYFLSLNPPGHKTLRVIFFIPALISLSAKSMMFLAIFAPMGLLNNVLATVGFDALTRPWLANQDSALGTIIAVDLWSGIGFTAVLFAARIASVDTDLFEAAALDGAGHWRRIVSIAYPICRDYFGVLAMLQFIWILFTSAGQVLLLTRGGPGNSSTTLSFLVYDKAFTQSQIGYSQAVAVLLFIVGIAGIALIRTWFRSRTD